MIRAHTYPCPSQLPTGPCGVAVPCECIGPFSQAGGVFSCGGHDVCEDCARMIEDGKRCDSCGLIDPSVTSDWTRDAYCIECWKLVSAPVEPIHGLARA